MIVPFSKGYKYGLLESICSLMRQHRFGVKVVFRRMTKQIPDKC